VERRRSAAIGIAGIEDGTIAWTTAVGAGDDTLFQAGSLSKTVSAGLALELVGRGELDLDSDVNEQLSSGRCLPVRARPCDTCSATPPG
jgi:CubicO group peptidase (beta-lactamase class C family)